MQPEDLGPVGPLQGAREEGGVIEDVASTYADEFHSAEDLAARALARLAWRVRRASAGACVVCGRPLTAKRADAETCSRKCRQKRARTTRVNESGPLLM